MAHNVQSSVWGDQQIERPGAESLNDVELRDAHSSAFCCRISMKVSVYLAIVTNHRPSVIHILTFLSVRSLGSKPHPLQLVSFTSDRR